MLSGSIILSYKRSEIWDAEACFKHEDVNNKLIKK